MKPHKTVNCINKLIPIYFLEKLWFLRGFVFICFCNKNLVSPNKVSYGNEFP